MKWIAVAVLVVVPVTAAADDRGGDDDGPYIFAAPQLGLGAPLGLLGIELGVGFGGLRLAGGVGAGTAGMQKAAMARAMTTISGFDVGVGLGVSQGPGPGPIALGESSADEERQPFFADDAVWANLELVVEVPLTRWSFTRFFAGVSYAASGGCDVSRDGPCDPADERKLEDERWLPYVGVAAVVRFPEGPARQTFVIPGTPPRM